MSYLPNRRASLAAMSGAAAALMGCEVAPDKHEIPGEFAGISHERGHLLRGQPPVYRGLNERRCQTLILGAGVAGLSAARALRLQGREDFAVIELEDDAGGNSRGAHFAGLAHPLGAHYLPVPQDDAPEVQDFLEELGIRQRSTGRWGYAESALCHSPQERLFFNGAWQESLLPMQGVSKETLAQYERFAKLVNQFSKSDAFHIPLRSDFYTKWSKTKVEHAGAAPHFRAFLETHQFTDPHLLWYLDYCCRDDYGAGIDAVSSFAGIHYFAARHGFSYSNQSDSQRQAVLTWPQGNAFLTQALAKPLGERLHTARVALRVQEERGSVTVDVWNVRSSEVERWRCEQCIIALPIHVARKIVDNPPEVLTQTHAAITHSSWWVANILLDKPLHDDGRGAHPAWDNVIYGSPGLGYVNAQHQSTDPRPGVQVLTYYFANGAGAAARQALYQSPYRALQEHVLRDLSAAHPDISRRAQNIQITRYGHAMAVPTSVFMRHLGQIFPQNMREQLSKSKHLKLSYTPRLTPKTPRIRFAHSDWSGYSVFEEAFTRGLHAAL